MAVLNRLAAKGKKPTFDLYRLTFAEFESELQEVVKDRWGVDVHIAVERLEEGPEQDVNITILNADEIDEDIVEKMQDDGMNPEEDTDVNHVLPFFLGGGQDMWVSYGWQDDKGVHYVNLMINPRQDVELKIVEVLDVALEGSRDDTIKAINQLLKEVRVK